MNTCHYCGHQGEDLILCEYYDPVLKRDVYDGWACKDINACLDREVARDREWAQALGIQTEAH